MQELNTMFERIIDNGLNEQQKQRLNIMLAQKQGKIIVFKLKSDNYHGQLCTAAALTELRLQMSTGDYHTHKAELIIVDDYAGVLDYDYSTHEFINL
jgi:hypothetical protein